MTLEDWMKAEGISNGALAAKLDPPVSPHTVKKWRRGERVPEFESMRGIERVTKGKVSLRDWERT
jgi:ribosome-binding protein aMBF1 (putative translation factor)